MKQGKYTALEILTAAKVEKPEDSLGKVRVRIAGILGIATPGHVIKLNPGKHPIVVGDKAYEIEVTEGESEISEGAKATLKTKGAKATEKMAVAFKAKGRDLVSKSEKRRLAELEKAKAKETK